MAFRQTQRYPEISPNMTMEEISRRWSELIRSLNIRDQQPLNPTEVFGTNILVGGKDLNNVVFVTAGTSLPNAPTPAYWHIYEYQIPREAGMVYVQPVSVSANANVQIQTFLPLAESVDGRTITIVGGNDESIAGADFNLGVFTISPNYITPIFGGSVEVTNALTGSLSIDTTVSTRLNNVGGLPIPSSAGGPLRLESRTSAGGFTGMVAGVDFGAGTLYPAENSFTNNTTTSAAISLGIISTAVYKRPLNYTLRAFGNRWVQIA